MNFALATSLLALAPAPAPLAHAPLAHPSTAAPEEIKYEERAKALVAEHGLDPETMTGVDLEAMLDSGLYAKIRLGVFDLRFPTSELRSKDRAVEFKDICAALVELQEHWVHWTVQDEARLAQLEADLKEAKKWVKGWSTKSLAMVEASDEKQLDAHLDPKPDVVEAMERLNTTLASGEFMGLTGKTMSSSARIVFAVDRKAFIDWACFAGLIEQRMQVRFWHESVGQWTKIWSDNTQFVAMEYPDFPYDSRYPDRGVTMNEQERSGVLQHAVDAAAASMFWHWFGPTDAFFFESGMATTLTVEVCGQNNIRIGGVTTKSYGNSTAPYSRFVPGGNPAGGTLPANSAGAGQITYVPQWRADKGADFFVGALAESQKQGGKRASKDKTKTKDKRDHFMLIEEEKSQRCVVSAPFFGKFSEGKKLPPNQWLDDYEDFFRAYKSGFTYWLRNYGGGKKEAESQAKFTELTALLAKRDGGEPTFAECLETVYGVPFSDRDGETDSLEWRFLTWISKQ